MIERLIKKLLNEGVLIDKKLIAVKTYRLTIASEFIKTMPYTIGQHLRFFVGENQQLKGKDNVRTYSIWQIDKSSGTIDIGVCCHAGGPGSKWAHEIEAGDKVLFSKPKGRFTQDNSFNEYIFIGDSSALSHLYELNRSLTNKTVHSFIYSKSKLELFSDVNDHTPFQYFKEDVNISGQIIDKLGTHLSPSPNKVIYIGGDGNLCVALNNYLINKKGWSRKQIKTKPFWMAGKKGLE